MYIFAFWAVAIIGLFCGISFGGYYLIEEIYSNYSFEINLSEFATWATLAIIFFIAVGIVAIYMTYKEIDSKYIAQKNEAEAAMSALNAQIIETQEIISQKKAILQKISDENSQKYPWLASIISNELYDADMKTVSFLKYKPRPAKNAAETVRQTAQEKRALLKQCKEYEHQLVFYETLFPWLEDFKELPPKEAYSYIIETNNDDEYSRVREWLSAEEYHNLPSHEKWQRALDNYIKRPNKTNWHIGIDYERFVGYEYEAAGYKITYEGALKGVEDRGRDLIAIKGNERLIIQCKRWSKEKTIHEKHIMQLFGSVAVLNMESKHNYKGVFITTTTLSPIANHFAKLLSIEVIENHEYRAYPMIKCNISKSGEKIYHLPFDQQYDRIHINEAKGNFYTTSVLEAEKQGFRHAYKWHGDK